jgi:hypothetical protein
MGDNEACARPVTDPFRVFSRSRLTTAAWRANDDALHPVLGIAILKTTQTAELLLLNGIMDSASAQRK